MHAFLKEKLPRGAGVNFVAHSMGGLDCRYLISTIKPTSYQPLSLTTIGTPHRGSPFMDWCAANIGVGSMADVAAAAAMSAPSVTKALPYSLKSPLLSRAQEQGKREGISAFTTALTSYLLNIFDSPAYSNLTTGFLRDTFNPATPDMAGVQYTSVAGRTAKMSVLHPLWFPKLVLDAAAENGYSADGSAPGDRYEGNDGLVSVASAQWGNFLGTVDDCHHWDLRGEGGLFPNVSAIADTDKKKREDQDQNRKIKGDADADTIPSSSSAWDWQGDFGNGVSEHLGLAADAAKSTVDRVKVAAGESAGKLSAATSQMAQSAVSAAAAGSANARRPDTWDLQQVGQVLDWVGDLLPGEGKETKERKMADAVREKEKAEYRREMADREKDMRVEERKEKEAARAREAERKKRQKFDLAKFYGGLMLKLRDDGL
jgi:triacylglycerol lipase